MKRIYITLALSLCTGILVKAQTDEYLTRYRAMALEYNQDVQASEKNILMSKELEQSAKADYKPKLSAGANFNYTGNPMELNIPSQTNPLSFQGKNMNYGASVSLLQPIYTGGRIKETVRLAQKEGSLALNRSQLVKADIAYEADLRYWNAVAYREIAGILTYTRQSVKELVDVVNERVQAELVAPNDLLMTEVKLNEADYLLLQAQNNSEVARLSLNSFVGVGFDSQVSIDSGVPAIEVALPYQDVSHAQLNRPEVRMALDQVDIQESMLKINDSRFLPQFYVGADGSYSSPGYNFKADLDPNYAVYAKVSVPLFEWGKRRKEKKASAYRVGMAEDNYRKVVDQVSLEVKSAYYSYQEATKQVTLTRSSLSKAAQNELMATDRYKEGLISIAEVLDAQLFHQTAQINYVQSRMNAQLSLSNFHRVLGEYRY